uniref:Uncharacterized protein n=1 Tax=Chromera velia CCMP2878 TaxID=1169474 RepID=A0A0G4FYL0_9ALVE|eukprot:Cvel_3873.t1-p1 / transcript=Cvel_3873.t1 / gene=Cvel_3873 / organism=Chromera_velia_CCMP2878 / gene_product=hypothetical protein / transcript_product=hypothetical protein / location=Cvel_scaffold164:24128-27604(+) / protein_length=188 / sequence_SO=supercontig / SO=protein_coding / is_pseudo=false
MDSGGGAGGGGEMHPSSEFVTLLGQRGETGASPRILFPLREDSTAWEADSRGDAPPGGWHLGDVSGSGTGLFPFLVQTGALLHAYASSCLKNLSFSLGRGKEVVLLLVNHEMDAPPVKSAADDQMDRSGEPRYIFNVPKYVWALLFAIALFIAVLCLVPCIISQSKKKQGGFQTLQAHQQGACCGGLL